MVWLTKQDSRTSKSRLEEIKTLLLEHCFLLQLVDCCVLNLRLLIYLLLAVGEWPVVKCQNIGTLVNCHCIMSNIKFWFSNFMAVYICLVGNNPLPGMRHCRLNEHGAACFTATTFSKQGHIDTTNTFEIQSWVSKVINHLLAWSFTLSAFVFRTFQAIYQA